MFKINLLCALTLYCTIVGIQCEAAGEDCCIPKDTKKIKRSCTEVPASGIYTIQPEKPFKDPISVLCDKDYDLGGWTVIQYRFDGSTNFFRNWREYKNGFGNLDDFDGNKVYAKYDQFEIGDESEKFLLKKLGGYSGTAGDSFNIAKGMKFSTFDADNDTWEKQCAVDFTGAWWYSNCHRSNLNGQYLRGTTTEYATGMIWFTFRGHYYSLKSSKIMIRPKKV